MEKKVSVGVAVYNGQDTLERAIISLINQSFENIEIIIIDDCSLDKSRDIIKKYAEKDKRIMTIYNKNNQGLVYNFNKLFKLSTGDYFLWADQDDFREKSFIEKTFNILEKNPNSILCHSETHVFFGDKKNILHKNFMIEVSNIEGVAHRYKKLLWYYNDTNIYGLIRSSALKKTTLWKKMNGSSNNLLFQLILMGKFEYVNAPLFFYSGKEIAERPSTRDEYQIISKKKPPILYFPGFILLKNQLINIFISQISTYNKLKITFFLIQYFLLTNLSKLIFRIFYIKDKNSINSLVLKFCKYLYPYNSEVEVIVDEKKYPKYFPKYNQFIKLK